jgi:hypothetical protein
MRQAIIPASAVPPAPAVAVPATPAKPARRQTRLDWVKKNILGPLASLRVTVVLFVFALVLVFCGSLAQVDAGNWTVVNQYFRTWGLVWVPFQIFFPRSVHVGGGFPYPGGYVLGCLLLINLLTAHAVRFRLSWKRSGVLLLHAGLIVMMISEWVTGTFAVEGNMTIEEGKSSNAVVHAGKTELAIVDRSDPKVDDVVVIPARLLRQGGVIRNELLPFEVEVVRYMVNSAVADEPPPQDGSNPATAGFGLQRTVVERPEVTGTDPQQRFDAASAYVTFKKKGTGESLGTYLVSLWWNRPQKVTAEGKPYEVSLRFKESYRPYTLYLKKFTHEVYEGTDRPKTYSSLVRLTDPERGEDRDFLISMNDPLRYRGETFYQADFLRGGEVGTILQVVRNPGWLLPYFACAMVGVGMLIHFVLHLVTFLSQQVNVVRRQGVAL